MERDKRLDCFPSHVKIVLKSSKDGLFGQGTLASFRASWTNGLPYTTDMCALIDIPCHMAEIDRFD